MPLLDGAGYLIDYLFDVGPTVGTAPIRSGDLLDWREETGIALRPWESRFLRHLSLEYLGQSQKSEKADCPAPWSSDSKPDFSAAQQSLRNLALIAAQQR